MYYDSHFHGGGGKGYSSEVGPISLSKASFKSWRSSLIYCVLSQINSLALLQKGDKVATRISGAPGNCLNLLIQPVVCVCV